MTGQTHQTGLEESGFNSVHLSWAIDPEHERQQDAGCSSGGKPCMKCDCCKFWTRVVEQITGENVSAQDTIQKLHDNEATLVDENQQLTGENVSANDTIQKLQTNEYALKSDNKRLVKANKRLNAKINSIKTTSKKSRTVPDKDRTSTGKVGRPRGSKPTKNMRPERITAERRLTSKNAPRTTTSLTRRSHTPGSSRCCMSGLKT